LAAAGVVDITYCSANALKPSSGDWFALLLGAFGASIDYRVGISRFSHAHCLMDMHDGFKDAPDIRSRSGKWGNIGSAPASRVQ
jgi:hypothetical protein